MKHTLIICILLFIGIGTAQAAKGTGPGISPMMNPNVKQGLVGMKVQPLTTTINQKINVTLYSYLPAGEKCDVYFKHPAQQYGPVKLLVSTSPYQVPYRYSHRESPPPNRVDITPLALLTPAAGSPFACLAGFFLSPSEMTRNCREDVG